jgi:hypothetical protein
MAFDVQINPTAPVLNVSVELGDLLNEHAQDFDIRYCAITADPSLITALRSFAPSTPDEKDAIAQILAALTVGDGVELLLSA